MAGRLTESCRAVDPTSTEETIKKAHAADVVEGEEHAKPVTATVPEEPPPFALPPPVPPLEPPPEHAVTRIATNSRERERMRAL